MTIDTSARASALGIGTEFKDLREGVPASQVKARWGVSVSALKKFQSGDF